MSRHSDVLYIRVETLDVDYKFSSRTIVTPTTNRMGVLQRHEDLAWFSLSIDGASNGQDKMQRFRRQKIKADDQRPPTSETV